MYVEGPHTPPSFSDFQSNRPNACPPDGSHVAEVAYAPHPRYTPTRRILPTTFQESSMPVSTSSQSLLASLPSFMSVFGNGPDKPEVNERVTTATEAPGRTVNIVKRIQNNTQYNSPLLRRDSASTFNDSIESSPTTTISTIESSLTEPSPNSPPDSPESLLPLASFKALRTNSVPTNGIMEEKDRKDHFSSSFPILPGVERAESPNKKMRNMKNLSVNTSASNRQGPALPKLGLSNSSGANHAFSAPPTPSFIVPPKLPRKKPSKLCLTITTPEATSTSQTVQDRPSVVPSTPSDPQIRTLRALQTSSNAPMHSPTVAPEGGMRLPPFNNPFGAGRFAKSRPPLSFSPPPSVDSSSSSPITKQTLEHVQEETDYDVPLSQEVKSPAYPQGPVCIYEPNVYLYLEPSHTEAREFDVVLNVAREVKNPFTVVAERATASQTGEAKVPMALDTKIPRLAGRDSISEPQTASSETTFESAFNEQPDDAIRSVPTTPKAWKPEPEYIHIPWDHNTNVVDDLLRLCELIDNRVRQEKRVLVHCQCGVSRSASLVVAYGLWRNPQLTVQEAYDAVKNRSRWIGPNMNLIYQLSEFKSKLKPQAVGISAWHSWRSLGSGRPNTNGVPEPELRLNLPSSSLRTPPQKSLSDPTQSGREPPVARSNSFSPPGSAQLAPVPVGDITPGPSSAPPNMQWSPDQAPMETAQGAKDSGGQTATGNPVGAIARLINVDTDMVLSPATMDRPGIEEKESPPIGGVTKDLQEIAKDLGFSEHVSTSESPHRTVEKDTTEHSSAPLPPTTLSGIATVDQSSAALSPPTVQNMRLDDEDSPIPVIPAAQQLEQIPQPLSLRSMPSLPAGFSSLLSRRQGPLSQRQLPLRPSLPRLVPALPPSLATDFDVPPTPSLLSPRAAEFTASPFHRTVAGDLAGSSVFEQGLMSPKTLENDPRSPHQKGEAPITRSIFDLI